MSWEERPKNSMDATQAEYAEKSAMAGCASSWDIPGMKARFLTGDVIWNLLEVARAKGFAIHAVDCTPTSSVNDVLEAGRAWDRPGVIRVTEGGAAFFAGRGLPNDKEASFHVGNCRWTALHALHCTCV